MMASGGVALPGDAAPPGWGGKSGGGQPSSRLALEIDAAKKNLATCRRLASQAEAALPPAKLPLTNPTSLTPLDVQLGPQPACDAARAVRVDLDLGRIDFHAQEL